MLCGAKFAPSAPLRRKPLSNSIEIILAHHLTPADFRNRTKRKEARQALYKVHIHGTRLSFGVTRLPLAYAGFFCFSLYSARACFAFACTRGNMYTGHFNQQQSLDARVFSPELAFPAEILEKRL